MNQKTGQSPFEAPPKTQPEMTPAVLVGGAATAGGTLLVSSAAERAPEVTPEKNEKVPWSIWPWESKAEAADGDDEESDNQESHGRTRTCSSTRGRTSTCSFEGNLYKDDPEINSKMNEQIGKAPFWQDLHLPQDLRLPWDSQQEEPNNSPRRTPLSPSGVAEIDGFQQGFKLQMEGLNSGFTGLSEHWDKTQEDIKENFDRVQEDVKKNWEQTLEGTELGQKIKETDSKIKDTQEQLNQQVNSTLESLSWLHPRELLGAGVKNAFETVTESQASAKDKKEEDQCKQQ